ncbi:MAG: 2-phospho-L-lactate guanylyltransferase [Acidimicrobiales bacterium]
MPGPVTVVVPVKDFSRAKVRLAPELDPTERAALARRMATVVVGAAAPLPVCVVCDSEQVRTWAEGEGARVIWTPGLGLNGAVQAGVERLATEGVGVAVIAHGDLPLATHLEWVAATPGVTIVPDRWLAGTNVLAVPTDIGFRFAYGAGSFAAHRAEAKRLGQQVRIVNDSRLGWDVDLPADLALPACP